MQGILLHSPLTLILTCSNLLSSATQFLALTSSPLTDPHPTVFHNPISQRNVEQVCTRALSPLFFLTIHMH